MKTFVAALVLFLIGCASTPTSKQLPELKSESMGPSCFSLIERKHDIKKSNKVNPFIEESCLVFNEK